MQTYLEVSADLPHIYEIEADLIFPEIYPIGRASYTVQQPALDLCCVPIADILRVVRAPKSHLHRSFEE